MVLARECVFREIVDASQKLKSILLEILSHWYIDYWQYCVTKCTLYKAIPDFLAERFLHVTKFCLWIGTDQDQMSSVKIHISYLLLRKSGIAKKDVHSLFRCSIGWSFLIVSWTCHDMLVYSNHIYRHSQPSMRFFISLLQKCSFCAHIEFFT